MIDYSFSTDRDAPLTPFQIVVEAFDTSLMQMVHWSFDEKNPFTFEDAREIAKSETNCLNFARTMMCNYFQHNDLKPDLPLINYQIAARWEKANTYRVSIMPETLHSTWMVVTLCRQRKIRPTEARKIVWEALMNDGSDIDLVAIEKRYKRAKQARPNFQLYRLDPVTLEVEHYDAFEGL